MQLFYTTNINGNLAELDTQDARHVQVLRKKVGDQIHLVDGKGTLYRAAIVETSKRTCLLEIVERQDNYAPRPFYLHLAVAPTKNIDRFEWLLEKATEIGVDEITPLLCHHSERRKIREDRLEKVLVAAMKQSLKAQLPRLNTLTPYKQFLKNYDASIGQSFIAHCEKAEMPHLAKLIGPKQRVSILIGPEGDFSSEEVRLALETGFQEISLGPNRLRTETAGVVACHTANLLNL